MTALTDTRDHARKMAGASTTPADEAALWMMLATEIDAYLAEDQPPAEGTPKWADLFGIDPDFPTEEDS